MEPNGWIYRKVKWFHEIIFIRKEWDNWYRECCITYNVSINTSAEFSPRVLMFGRT